MDPSLLHRKVAIVGVAESDIGRVPHKSKFQLSAEASKKALDEAGLTKDDVDGLFTTIITDGGQFSSMMMAEYLATILLLGNEMHFLKSIASVIEILNR